MKEEKAVYRSRPETIGIPFTADEKKAIETAADLLGLTTAAYCRMILISSLKTRKETTERN